MVMTVMAMIFSLGKEYHWTIFVLILPLIRYSGTDFDSFRYSPPLMSRLFRRKFLTNSFHPSSPLPLIMHRK